MSTPHRILPGVALLGLIGCGMESELPTLVLQADRFAGSEWSTPVNLGPVVNSSVTDANAALSPDEHTLYFVSNRPGGLGGLDIWASDRRCLECPWEAPYNVGAPINSAFTDASPTLSENGRMLFFFSDRPGGVGGLDIYVSHRVGTSQEGQVWGDPVNLGTNVNTTAAEQGVHYVREGGSPNAVLYFNRVPVGGTLDIHKVAIGIDGMPLEPAAAVPELNSPAADQKVTVRTDGLELLLSSTRTGTFGGFDIWKFTRQTVKDDWSAPAHFDAPLNTTDIDSQPSLSRDGRTLIFTSNRMGGSGGNDLWMSTRKP